MFHVGKTDKWYEHDDVKKIAAEIVRFRNTQLTKFVRDATLDDWRARVDDLFIAHLGRDPDLVAAAHRVAKAGARIAADPHRDNLRGAVVARMTCELVVSRAPNTAPEVSIKLANGRYSNPKDVVGMDDPVEVYECKASTAGLQQTDLDELVVIRRALAGRGRESRCGFIILGSRTAVQTRIGQLTVKRPLYWASADELVDLGNVPAGEAA